MISVYVECYNGARRAEGRVREGVTGGALQAVTYGAAVWAMSVTALGAVSTLRETSVIFAAAIGALALGERFGGARGRRWDRVERGGVADDGRIHRHSSTGPA